MKNVTYDRVSRSITGVDRQPLPFEGNIMLPYAIRLQKTVYTAIEGSKVQKRNDAGELLYLDNLVLDENDNLVSADEVTYSHKEVDGKLTELYPATEPAKKAGTYRFEENFSVFTADEVIEAKKKSINANELTSLVYFDEDLSTDGFSTELASFEADMGEGFIAVHPGGEARTVKLPLGVPTQVINIYFEGATELSIEVGATSKDFVKVENGVAILNAPTSEVYVKFINGTDRKREVHAFGILV